MATRKPAKSAKADTAAETLIIDSPAAGTDIATLTADQRAELVLAFDATRTKLQALAKQSSTLTKVDTDDNLAAAKSARAKLQAARVTIEKTGKAARDETTKFNKAVISKERELIAEISPEEERLAKLILDEQRRQEEAERLAREEEQRRAEAIRAAFERVRSLPAIAATMDVFAIDELIAEATRLLNDQSHLPEDLRAAGRYEANLAINELKAARDRRVQADKDAAELAAFRAQQAAQQAAQEAQEAKPAQEGSTEQRAQANAAEAQRAAQVVRGGGFGRVPQVHTPDDDDDLPPGHSPAPVPGNVVVPLAKVMPLLTAAQDVMNLLRRKGLTGEDEAVNLAIAIVQATDA
jgi:hypothetical protein